MNSGSASICARIDQPHGAATSTGRNMTQIARGPAPSERAAAVAIANAETTNTHVAIESSACPPSEYTPYMKSCASHCWSVHVAPRP